MKRSFIKISAAILCAALAFATYGNASDVLAYEGEESTVVTTSNTMPAPYDNTLTLEENNIDFMEIARYINYVRSHRRDYDDVAYFEVERDVLSYYMEFLSQQGIITSEEDLAIVRDFAAQIRNTQYDPNLSVDENIFLINLEAHEVYLTYFRSWDGI